MMADNLKELLQRVKPDLSEDGLMGEFKEVAEDLISNYEIRKGNITYKFMEIEFYYFCENHQDIITYPRHADAGDWFFHASGVDICFDSNVDVDRETHKIKTTQIPNDKKISFGGILIRSLRKMENGYNDTFITGPQNCCYELFDKFSGIGELDNFPTIQKAEQIQMSGSIPCGRFFHFSTSLENKLATIKKSNWEEIPNIGIESFETYLKKEYCFYDNKSFDDFHKFINRRKENKEFYKNYSADPTKSTERLKFK